MNVRFKDLELDLAIKLNTARDPSDYQELSVIYIGIDSNKNIPIFTKSNQL